MRKIKKKQFVEATIESLSSKGNGLGVFKNKEGTSCKIEVPFAIPGDKVKALLLKKNRAYILA